MAHILAGLNTNNSITLLYINEVKAENAKMAHKFIQLTYIFVAKMLGKQSRHKYNLIMFC